MSKSSKNLASIRLLSKSLIDQISAGEVIENPASIVKELLDNSIDAQAKSIQVEILSKDIRSLRVIDNGLGIREEDLIFAFTNHATSKINSLEDLLSLQTKGFRGEALASISSISDLTCLTKHQDSEQAFKIYFDRDLNLQKTKAAFNQGTCFEIRDIFGRVPARLKFLSSPQAESQKVYQVVRELAIAHPEISFELKNRGKVVFKTLGDHNQQNIQNIWHSTIKALYQEDLSLSYFENLRDEEPFMQLKGYLAPLSAANSSSKSIVTIVNKRPIVCPIIRKAVRYIYQGLLPQGKYPRLFLDLTLDPREVDFNVHPTKKEVRYQNAGILYRLVLSSLEKALILGSKAPEVKRVDSTSKNTELELFSPPGKKTETKKALFREKSSLEEKTPESKKALFTEKTSLEEKTPEKNFLEADIQIFRKSSSDFRVGFFNEKTLVLESKLFYVLGKLKAEEQKDLDLYLEFLESYINRLESQENVLEKSKGEQKKIFETFQVRKRRKKISFREAEETWQKFNWRCAYCGKLILHPLLVRKLSKLSEKLLIKKLDRKNKIRQVNLLREHQATIDHLLPVSNHPSLEKSPANFVASCFSCNRAKHSSQDYHRWRPELYPVWPEELRIADLLIYGGQKEAKFERLLDY